MSPKLKSVLPILAKLTISVVLLTGFVEHIDWDQLWTTLTIVDRSSVAVAGVALVSLMVPFSIRWRRILDMLQTVIPIRDAMAMTGLMFLVNQCVPSNLGGDAYRIYSVIRRGGQWQKAVLASVLDKAVGLSVLSAMVVICTIWLVHVDGPRWDRTVIIAGIPGAFSVVVLAYLFTRYWAVGFPTVLWGPLRRLVDALRPLESQPRAMIFVAVLTLGAHALNIFAMMFIGRAYGIQLDTSVLFSICALGLMMTRLPLSINGWGVREATLVAVSVPLGVDPEVAFATSITYGATELAAGLAAGGIGAVLSAVSKLDARRRVL